MVDTTRPIKILGIPGSLRQASYNKAALKAAQELLPAGATLEIFGLDGIPPFSEDDERAFPPRVVELKARVREADAILIAILANQSRTVRERRPQRRRLHLSDNQCASLMVNIPAARRSISLTSRCSERPLKRARSFRC